MGPLEVRIVTPAERRERLCRLMVTPKRDVLSVATPARPYILNEQMAAAHKLLLKGGFTKIETIQRGVIEQFPGVTLADLRSSRRIAKVVKPRQIAMYLAKEMTYQSFPDIGRRFNRDHTTVLHAVRKIERLIETESDLANLVERIKRRVETAQ